MLNGPPEAGRSISSLTKTQLLDQGVVALDVFLLEIGEQAGILAASIVGSFDQNVALKMDEFKTSLREKVEASALQIEQKGWKEILKK